MLWIQTMPPMKGYVHMIYQPTVVKSENDLKAAVTGQKTVIVLQEEKVFWELEAAERKVLNTHKNTRAGGNALMAGGAAAIGLSVAAFFSLPVLIGGAAAVAIGGGTKLLGGAVTIERLGDYTVLFDYENRYVFLVKAAGESKVEENDKPWINLKEVYAQMPEHLALRRADGTRIKNRVENGILKLLMD